jgi:hypothetical protein
MTAVLDAGASHIFGACGQENDIQIEHTATYRYGFGYSAVAMNMAAGAAWDAAYEIGAGIGPFSTGTLQKWSYGILASDVHTALPFRTTATFMGALFPTLGTQTMATGIDMQTNLTFTNNAFQSANWAVNGSGVMVNGGTGPTSTTDVFGFTPWIQVSTLNGTRAVAKYALYSNNANAAYLSFQMSRGTSVGSNVAVQSGDGLMYITATGYDATGTPALQESANIQALCDAAPTAGSVAGRLSFQTAASGAGPTEAQRLDSTGAAFFPRIGTTASAANAFINNASTPANSLLRSTSSRRYKKKIKPISDKRLANADKFQPVEYSSRATADDKNARFVGLVAEDVAEIDPALVSYDADGRPDGVMYDRVLLLQVAALMRRVRELETKLERTL